MAASDGPGPETWEYDVLAVAETGGVSLRHIAFDIFAREGLVEHFGIPEERFKALLERLELLYSVENPYHCALHAADVLAATHCLHKGLPPAVFDPVEVLALYLGALGHDAGHFRLNNAFLKNSKHALYKKYRESVLENFHLGLLFELLEDEDVGIVAFLEEKDKERFRNLVTTLILATDMAKHMGLFKQLQAFLNDARAKHRELTWMHDSMRSDGAVSRDESDEERANRSYGEEGASSRDATPRSSANLDRADVNLDADAERTHESWVRPSIDGADAEQRVLVMQLLLKCADLANVVRPLEIADAWGKRIMEEFYQQGEKELTLGLPLTTFPNRKNFDYIFARHQNGFLVNVVRPLFDVFTSLCDFDTRESVIASAAENGDAWTRRENAHRPREKGPGGEDASKEGKDGARGKIGSTHPARKPGALARQSTMGWVQEFKQSNLTMLTANAMEMKGLHLTLDFEYGADDECASAVRSLVPYVSRGELARLGRQGLLEADPEEAHSPPSDKSVLSSKTFAAKLAATETFDAAVVVATFDGFLDLERRAAAEAEAEARASKKEASKKEAREKQAESSQRAAEAFGAALSGMLAKAVDSVHASGGDVVRMGHDGIVCVFPLSGGGDAEEAGSNGGSRAGSKKHFGLDRDRDRRDEALADASSPQALKTKAISEQAAAALRAARCAFTLVSQLSSAAPELSDVGAPDGGASRAHKWPGLRAFSKGTRVMVVESLQLSRMGLGRLLDHFGCMTHFAENASQAAAACANMEFDVILMNVLLPVKDGYELSRHIRAHGGPVNGRAYIAAVTYVQQPELLDQCVAAGMNEVIVKPATMSSLRLMFRRAKRRAREMKMQDALRQHSFSSENSGSGNGVSRQTSDAGRGPGSRGASRRDTEVVVNPYSLSGARSKKPAKRKPGGAGAANDDALARDGAGTLNLADARLSIGSGHVASLVETDLTRGAKDKCVPVHLPRYSDMLISSSVGPQARRRRFANASRALDDAAVGASSSSSKAGKQTGAMSRFWRALCGYDDGFANEDERTRRDERAALHERSTLFASGARLGSSSARVSRKSSDDGSGTTDSGKERGFEKAALGVSLARYKSSSAGHALSTGERGGVSSPGPPSSAGVMDTLDVEVEEEESDDELDDVDDETLDETAPLPVTIAVSAAVGFGRVAAMRVGTSCGAALEGVRRDENLVSRAPWDTLDGSGHGSGGTLLELAESSSIDEKNDSVVSTPEKTKTRNVANDVDKTRSANKPASESGGASPRLTRSSCPVRAVMLSADRDVVVAADAPVLSPGSDFRDACEAATAAAAGGPKEGGPFQQAASLIRVATAGDVALSPAAWRLVRLNCEGDTPPVLRGGARLNRIRVHEVVPPLTNHAIAQRELASFVPSSPDPRRALAALAALVPRPVRLALADRASAAAAALARRRDRRDAGFAESDEERSASEHEEDDVVSNNSTDTDKTVKDGLRRLPMPRVAPRAADVVCAVVYLPGPSCGARRTRGDSSSFAQTVASATAAVCGLLQRFPHGSLTRVGSDVLFGRDVDKRTGGAGGGGDGVVLHCDFSPPLPKPAEARRDRGTKSGGARVEASNDVAAGEMSLSERRAAAAAAATAFALAARSAMAHLGHAGASVGVASGRAVTMAAGAAERRCEWTVTGDVVARAERLAASADAEVLCDLLVVKQCASSGMIDFDPLPHVSGDDVVCARNLSAGHLDRIVGIAGGSRRHANGGGGNFFVSDGGGDFASSSMLGRLELTERGAVAGDGVAPGPCILMPQGTRENFGDASAKRRALREKEKSESDARESEDADGHVASETIQKSSAEDDAARRATEAEAISTAAGRLSYGALAALSLASASVATAETLRLLWDRHGKLPAPPPLVAHETTLLAAKRVIAEAQEAMAPRLLFLEGPARAGKTRAAAAVLDLPEARRMWLLRTRGAHAVDEATRRDPRGGGGAAILSSGSFALASFQRLFHQLLGFSPEATSRERKAAVVALLEGCGEERERLGRYAKPILEILGIERADEGGADDEDVLGSDRGSSRLSNGSTGKTRLESRASSDAVSSGKAHGVTSKSRSTRGGVSRRGGLSLEPESPAADGDAEGSGSGSGSQPPADGAVAAKRKPSRQASRLGLARDRSEASQIGEPLPGERASRERGEREGLGGFLDAVSAAAMEDATRHLCSGAMDALLGDGVDIEHDGCEGPDRREARDGDDGGDGYDDGDDEDHRHPHHHHHDSEQHDSSAEAKMARAVIMGRLSGAVAFTRQRNGVQRRDHNKRFRAVLQRRKNTLESILVSTHGAARLCKTMALMLERLLLGRATQAAPAQPSLPGWILLVEDAQWLDPYSMGLIRALLERCSIPLVVVMTHVSGRGKHDASSGVPETRVTRPDATTVDARSVGRADESMHDVDESAHGGVRLYSSGDASSSAGDTISAEASARSGAAGGVGVGLDRVDVWGAGLGLSTTRVEAMDTKRWLRRDLDWMLELYSTTVVDVAPLSRSDLRVFVEECASRALRGGSASPFENEKNSSSEDTSERDSSGPSEEPPRGGADESSASREGDSGAIPARGDELHDADAEDSNAERNATREKTHPLPPRSTAKSAFVTRRAGGGARSVGLPSAVHAELYKNTGGDPLHAASLANLLVSCGAVSVIQKGVGGVPEVVVKGLGPEGADGEQQGLSSASVARMHARDATMESLERRLSPDAFTALKTLAASGGRIRAAQAHALVARRLATREKEKLESRESMASVFRREFVSNLAVGVDDARSFALLPTPWNLADGGNADGEVGDKERLVEHVADPRAVALAYGAARCAPRASAAIVELVRAGVLTADWGAHEDARAAAEAAAAEAAVAFAVADIPFPLADLDARLSGETPNEKDLLETDASNQRGSSRKTHSKPGSGSSKTSGTGLGLHDDALKASASASSSARRSLRSGDSMTRPRGRRAVSAWTKRGSSPRVPWLVFANDDVRVFAYESQAAWRRRAAHLDAMRALRDEAQYCVGDDVATLALVYELASKHLAQAQAVDRAALAAYDQNSNALSTVQGTAEDAAAASSPAGSSGTQGSVGAPLFRADEKPAFPRASFDGPSSATAAVVAAERALERRSSYGQMAFSKPNALTIGASFANTTTAWSDAGISPREILLAASGLWHRVRFHEDVTTAHMRRGTIRAAILSASSLSIAAAAWAEISKELRRAFGKRHPRLVEQMALANEDGKNLIVRSAAWSLTISRLVLNLGDVAPPFLTAEGALARDRRSPLHHARRAFLGVELKWPFDAIAASASAFQIAESNAAREADELLPSAFLGHRLADGARDDVFLGDGEETRRTTKKNARRRRGMASCFGEGEFAERAVPGAHGVDAALRRAVRSLFAHVEVDHEKDHRLAETGRGTGKDASTRGGSLSRGGSTSGGVDESNPFSVPATAIPGGVSRDSRETIGVENSSISPLCEMRAGIGDALQYAAQIYPRSSKAERKFAQAELAYAVAENVALAAVFAGRPAFAAAAVVRLAKCFASAPEPAPTDAATLLCLNAAIMPEGDNRERALRRAEEILDADAQAHAKSNRAAFAEAPVERVMAATASRKAFQGTVRNASETTNTGSVSLGVFAQRALGGKRVQFTETPPSPRAGTALVARAMALCARGDWFAARGAAAAAAALLEKPGASDLRLCDVARVLGAAAEAHLGHWESCAASAKAIAHDREYHGELGPWVLALRMASLTASFEYATAARTWRDALRRVPFSAVPLGAAAYADASFADATFVNRRGASSEGLKSSSRTDVGHRNNRGEPAARFDVIVEDKPSRAPPPVSKNPRGRLGPSSLGGASSRDFPAYVCCRAFAAQALWSAGERAEAIILLEQVCGDQLVRLKASTHCLLPAAALAAGETAARACRVGAFEKKTGRRLLAETHAFLERAANVTPFAEDLAARLREVAPVGYL